MITSDLAFQIQTELVGKPEIVPTKKAISEYLKEVHGITISPRNVKQYLGVSRLQVDWINAIEDARFLDVIGAGSTIGSMEPEAKNTAQTRLEKIVGDLDIPSFEVLPTRPSIATALGTKFSTTVSEFPLKKIDLVAVQCNWVETCSEHAFLHQFSSGCFRSVKSNVKAAIDARMVKVLLAHPDDFSELEISLKTIDRYADRYPDQLGFLKSSGSQTVDQRIVLSMGALRKGRSKDLHAIIGTRLEQLWGFRELYGLLAGVLHPSSVRNADIISPFHELLPEKMSKLIPEITLTHHFPDDVLDERFEPNEGPVVLLSVMQWLSDSQTSDVLARLNRSISVGTPVVITNPVWFEHDQDLEQTLSLFGFQIESTSTLHLDPSEDPKHEAGDIASKLKTVCSVTKLRKQRDVTDVPGSAHLLSRKKPGASGAKTDRVTPSADEISYGTEDVAALKPAISLVTAGTLSPLIEGLSFMAKLSLEGGVSVNITLDPTGESPPVVQIEGDRRRDSNVLGAVQHLLNGEEGGFSVSSDLTAKHAELVRLLKRSKSKPASAKPTVQSPKRLRATG